MAHFVKHTAIPFLITCLCAFLLASVLHSLFVLKALIDIDVEIGLSRALQMIVGDLLGLLPTYGVIIAVTLTLAFTFARFAFLRQQRPASFTVLIYALAGTVGFFVMLSAMQPILNVTLIAGARSTAGLIAQCFSGLVGGIVFCALRQRL
jgi:hypothetical protein